MKVSQPQLRTIGSLVLSVSASNSVVVQEVDTLKMKTDHVVSSSNLPISEYQAICEHWNGNSRHLEEEFTPTVIDNGVIKLGVQPEGQLNVGTVGLQFMEVYESEATSWGCACEGWGVGADGVAGYANEALGINIVPTSFTSTASTAVSVVDLPGNVARVTHDYHPSPVTPNLYEVTVTLENTSGSTIDDLIYRRKLDWDVSPTAFHECVTMQPDPSTVSFLMDARNNGFGSTDPYTDMGGDVAAPFTDLGPLDQGAGYDFQFDPLPAGESRTFQIFYGAAANQIDAEAALAAVGAEVYSFGKSTGTYFSEECTDVPNTYIFGFRGVGGAPVFTAPSVGTTTEAPTSIASATPTETLTEMPSVTPTDMPTMTPTEMPTATPTETPSAESERPTSAPTKSPTETPFAKPTNTPTESPTGTPVIVDTTTPAMSLMNDTATPVVVNTTADAVTNTSATFVPDDDLSAVNTTETPTLNTTETPGLNVIETPTGTASITPSEAPITDATATPTLSNTTATAGDDVARPVINVTTTPVLDDNATMLPVEDGGPIAICVGATIPSGVDCEVHSFPVELIDGGSHDPNSGDLTFALSPGPFDVGVNNVTLIVTDDKGVNDTCTANVTVVASSLEDVSIDAGHNYVVFVGDESTETSVSLDGFVSDSVLQTIWWTDCPGGSIGDILALDTKLTLPQDTDVATSCSLTLVASNGCHFISDTATVIVIRRNNAEYAVGKGWIESTAGSYTPQPNSTGMTLFDFEIRYRLGDPTPSGFFTANGEAFSFHSHDVGYEWLVIGETCLTFQGYGKLNADEPNYGFLVTACDYDDGPNDAFRVRIWKASNGAVVYDNKLGSPANVDTTGDILAGGNIEITHDE